MNTKSVTRVSLLLVATLLVAAAPLAAQGEDILLYGGNQDIDNIDPATGENYSINAALRSLYDALFINRGSDVLPHLVKDWNVDDAATVWTFNLHDNAVFHDGSPVNAEAVAYSFNRILDINGPPNFRWGNIADENTVEAVDEYTVRFTLTEPFAPFIGTLTQLFVVNPAIVEENRVNSSGVDDYGQEWMQSNAAGSGPFMQGRWEIGNIYEFIAVQDYWAGWTGEDNLDGFFWIIQREGSTQLNSLLAGETHIADTILASDKEQVVEAEGFFLDESSGLFINTIKMNNQGEYTSNVHVRKAIAHAMNYPALPEVQDVKVTLMPGPTPSNFPGFVPDLDIAVYDLDKAREHLAMSPWPDGGFELDYVYVTDFTREEIPGLLLLEALRELNITMNMVPTLWPDMVASCGDPATGPDLINIYTLPPFSDPHAHLYNQYHSDQWTSGAGSFQSCSFYQNERVDELLDEARSLGDQDQRMELYAEAQTLIAEDQTSIWMYTEDSLTAFNDCVKGFVFSPFYPITVLFQDLWMDNCG
ncbi:MAG: ABC transporter substrate-binding protein [Anaerolineaceae bacterium]|nr:ABC transporter substrate-binding protein [Anaerolineaceae bacterium]